MRPFAALFRRELTSRWPALAASLVMGTFIGLLPVLSTPGTVSAAELRGLAGAGVILVWTAILALLLGTSLFAREVGGGAFDFRLPASGITLWFSRLTAALALLALGAGLVLLPSILLQLDSAAFRTALAAPSMIPGEASPLFLLLFYLGALTFLLLLTNAVSLAARTRGAWSTLDLASATILAGAIGLSWRRLSEVGAPLAVEILLCLVSAQLLATLLVASAAQIARGRGEGDRAHRAHAIVLFVGATIAAVTTLVTSSWYVNVTPSDLAASYSHVTPVGAHRVIATGPVRGRIRLHVRFLIDLRNGSWRRLDTVRGPRHFDNGKTSADDRIVAWFEADRGARKWSSTLILHDSPDLEAPSRETAISFGELASDWTLSPDGRNIALTYAATKNESAFIRLLQIDPAEELDLVSVDGCRSPGELHFRGEESLFFSCFDPEAPGTGIRRFWKWFELRLDSGELRASVEPVRSHGLGTPFPGPERSEPLTLSVATCVGKHCRLLARLRPGRKSTWMSWEVLLLDEISGEESVLVPAAELARTDEEETRLAIVQDERNRWYWFDAEAAELRPVFDESQYAGTRRVYGY